MVVACRLDHLLIVQLSRQGRNEYAVRFECTSPVEKVIYHGSKAWSLAIIPLHDQKELSPGKMVERKSGLSCLEGYAK
ncbi:MAG: hypothetical protein DME65_10175 [Verrucomicrobia bacterium]|nr:MAG: hypothetical protein DME65_10175 [Verrucomicrobiota bacterium]